MEASSVVKGQARMETRTGQRWNPHASSLVCSHEGMVSLRGEDLSKGSFVTNKRNESSIPVYGSSLTSADSSNLSSARSVGPKRVSRINEGSLVIGEIGMTTIQHYKENEVKDVNRRFSSLVKPPDCLATGLQDRRVDQPTSMRPSRQDCGSLDKGLRPRATAEEMDFQGFLNNACIPTQSENPTEFRRVYGKL